MSKPSKARSQMVMSDMMLAMNEADTFILIAINSDDVSIFSTLENDSDVALYLQASAKAVFHD